MSFGQLHIPLIAITAYFGLSFACIEPPPSTHDCKHFYGEINSEELDRQFRTFDTEKQFRVYRCGIDQIPMQTAMSIVIANKGPAIIPDLLRRLRDERDPATKYSIILIFDLLSARGDLKDRPDVISAIREEINAMPRGWEKDYSEDLLKRIDERLPDPR
jgi:hypothetical protein